MPISPRMAEELGTPDSVAPRNEYTWESTSSPGEACCPSSFESQYDYECETNPTNRRDKSSLSGTNDFKLRDVITVEPINSSDRLTQDKYNSFRSTRMRGTSSDRILAKKRHDQTSVSSLGDRTTESGSTNTGLFEKHLGKFYKIGRHERPKRSSTTAIYDQSPTEAFYNKTGSVRLSSQELFEKFCSQDFVSLYGHENDNGDYKTYYRTKREHRSHSKSLESTRNMMQTKSSMTVHHDQYSPKKLDKMHRPKHMSLSHTNLGATKKTRRLYTKRIESSQTFRNLDDSIDFAESPDPSAEDDKRTHFPFDAPYSLPPNIPDIIDYEDGSLESLNPKDQSRSAPLLSPEKDDQQFSFDIPDVSKADDSSNLDDSPSDATETRNLTLYEEPHSDRTSLSDIYEPCFPSGIRSKRSSFKRDVYKNQPVFDLTALDFRPIDDESPNTSKFVSMSSPDGTIPSNLDTKSYYSDSVFVSPEKISSKDDSSKRTDTTAKQRSPIITISERSDSTTLEDEPNSTIDKIPEILIERSDQISIDYGIESRYDFTERTLSPVIEQAIEAKSDSINLSEASDAKISPIELSYMASRPSMHKLEPFYPRKQETEDDALEDKYEKVTDPYKVNDHERLPAKKSIFSRMRKMRETNAEVHQRTRCFPL